MNARRKTSEPRVALITGAARGIGLETAQQLADRGFTVMISDISDSVDAVAKTLRLEGGDVHGRVSDVSNAQERGALISWVEETYGRLDVLVNNAGISPKEKGRRVPTEHTSLADWTRVLNVNLNAPFDLCRLALPIMRRGGWGRIVNLSSQAGRSRSSITGIAYSSSKAGVLGLTRTIAEEEGQHGITANCVAPGRIATQMIQDVDPQINETIRKGLPVRRLGTVQDVAAAICFLASEDAQFITGTTIDVTGGGFMN